MFYKVINYKDIITKTSSIHNYNRVYFSVLYYFSIQIKYNLLYSGVAVVMFVQQLDLQLPMQSVLITTNVGSSNTAQARCTRYNIM
jgi:hypothetical protein